jgi:nitroreductase
MTEMLEQFEMLVRSRRATRHFKPDLIPDDLLTRVLDAARWAPSGYNLQPTHFTIVTDAGLKEKLFPACMDQRQVLDAPAILILSGDKRVVEHHFEDVLRHDRDKACINEEYESLLRKIIPLAFGTGPVGVGWLWKSSLAPIGRCVKPIPSIPAVHRTYWVTKQVMLSAMTLMLAATAAGLATVPMEGFDEGRVKRILRIPRSHAVPIVIPIGYAKDATLKKTRLPLERIVHRNAW